MTIPPRASVPKPPGRVTKRMRESLAYKLGAREGWMRCGVSNIDIHFEMDLTQIDAINQRWPLSSPSPLKRTKARKGRGS